MTHKENRFLDELAKLATDTLGVAQGACTEVNTLVRSCCLHFLNEMDIVKRDEFDAMRHLAMKACAENEALQKRLEALEACLQTQGLSVPDAQDKEQETGDSINK